MKEVVAWRGGLFLTEAKIGVLSVSSLFSTRVGVYVGVCVCIRTHAHTHCTDGVLGFEPRSRDETPGGPKESRWTKSRHTYIRIFVQSIHVYIYATASLSYARGHHGLHGARVMLSVRIADPLSGSRAGS